MPKTPAQKQQEQLKRQKDQKEIQDQLALIAVAEERKKNFAAYKDKQAAIREGASAPRQEEYERYRQKYEAKLATFKENSFNSTHTWSSAQMAIAQLCLLHMYKQQAWRNKLLLPLFDSIASALKVRFKQLSNGIVGIVARLSKPPVGNIDLPVLKCELQVGTQKNTNNPTISMTRTIGGKLLDDFLSEAEGMKDVAQFSQQTQAYFDKELELWLEKHGYELNPADNTVKPIAPNTAPFSETVFKRLNRQDSFEEYLKKDMPRMQIHADPEENNSSSLRP